MTEIMGLADKDLFRRDEAAAYFGVTERTIRLWEAHDHLRSNKLPSGSIRITRESILTCRLGRRPTVMKSKTIGIVGKPVVERDPSTELDKSDTDDNEPKVEGKIKKRGHGKVR